MNVCRQNGLDVRRFNIQQDVLAEGAKADVVVSTEVAEHLPESCADKGFKYDEDISAQFRTEWEKCEVSPWFIHHSMVFRKQPPSATQGS